MRTFKVICIVQLVVNFLLLGAVVFLLIREKDTPKEETPVEIIETEPETETVPPAGQKILLNDGAFGEIWVPVLPGVPVCSHNPEQIASRNGLSYYVEDGSITSALGVDVSAHQKAIDWQTVKAAGVDFAMIRCGYRGYGSGKLVEDEFFETNMRGALDAGLDVGVYFYSQAVTTQEAIEEAEMTLRLCEGYTLTYPIVYDWEVVTEDTARTDTISVETLTACTTAFCDTIREAGQTPMVYQNKRTSLLKLDLTALAGYDFWLAEYNDLPTYYYDYRMWQYCSDGRIPGIAGDVDLNICYTPY